MNKDILAKATTLRRELHAHPELSYQEVWTKQHLMDFLKENTKVKLVDKGKWFYACYLGADGKDPYPIGFRADFDALPTEDEIDALDRISTKLLANVDELMVDVKNKNAEVIV